MKNSNPYVSPFQASFLRPLCLAAALLFAAAPPGWAADSSWDEEDGGDFDTAGNWTAGVPGAGDIATFALNETYTVEFGSATTSNLRAVVSNGTVTWDLDGNTYALTAPGSSNSSSLTEALIVQGASGQSANLVITGGGTLETLDATANNNARIGRLGGGSGSVTVDDATWNTVGGVVLGVSNSTSALTVQNGGVVTSSGSLILIANTASTTVTVTGSGSVLDVSTISSSTTSGTNTVLIEDGAELLIGANLAVQGGGTMTVTGSDTVFNYTGATARTVSVANGGSLTISDGVNSNLAIASATGTFILSGGTVFGRDNQRFDLENTGSQIVTITGAGTVLTTQDIRFRGNDSTTNNEHRITVSDGAVLNARNLFGATADRTGSEILVTGANSVANFIGGATSVNLAGIEGSTQFLTVSDGGTLNTYNLYVGSEGQGTATVDGGTVAMSNGTMVGRLAGGGGLLTVTNGGELTTPTLSVGQEGDGTLLISGGGSVTTTSNSFVGQLAGSSGSVTINGATSTWTLENSTLTVGGAGTGILTLEEGAFLTANAVVIGATGTLAGDGIIFSPTVTNAGLVSPGNSTAILYVTGNYTQEATGTLEIGIGGTTPGSGHDQLSNYIYATTATLEGTLTLLSVDEFMPSIGDSFLILDFVASGGSIVGEFDTINAFNLPGGHFWDFDNLYSLGTVSVIPEPATVAFLLGALALAGVLWRRRLRNP